MIYIVDHKQEGKTTINVLRICTEESELWKVNSRGETHKRRNCEYWPDCKSQDEANEIAYRLVLCDDGVQRPRIDCALLHTGVYCFRRPGSRKASDAAIEAQKQEVKTSAGKASQKQTNSDSYGRVGGYEEFKERQRKYQQAHKNDPHMKEYRKKYYEAHKAEYLERARKWYKQNTEYALKKQKELRDKKKNKE